MKKKNLFKSLTPFLALIAVYALFKFLQPVRFGKWNSMYVLLQQALTHSILACGFYYILTMNIYDLTIGINAIISSMMGVWLSEVLGFPGLLIGAIGSAVFISLISWFLMTSIDAPPIIISVALVIIYEALSLLLCRGATYLAIDPSLRILGKAPAVLFPGIFVLLISALILKYSKLGVYMEAIGTNPNVSQAVGLPVKKYKAAAFAVSGVFIGIYAAVSLSYSASVAAASNMSSVTGIFKPFMACMFAAAYKKYLNPMAALLLGCFMLNMLSNGLMTNGLEVALQNVVVGFAMILLVRFSTNARKFDVVK